MASSALFYFDNLTEHDGVSLTVTSADTEHPKQNLQDRDQHTHWKPANTTNPQQYDFDFGSAQEFQGFALLNVNLYTENIGLCIIVDAYDSGAYGNPVYLVGSAVTPHSPTAGDQPLWYERASSAQTKRYLRYELHHLGTPSTDLLVGAACAFPEIDTARHPGDVWKLDFDDATKLQRTPAGIYATSPRAPADEFGLGFKSISKTLRDQLLAGYDIVRAGFLPFLYVDEYGNPKWVRLTAKPSGGHKGLLHDLTFRMAEDY